MKKKLITQISNEWRSNLWLALELLMVSVLMWYIIDFLYCRIATYTEPRGYNIEHCYLISMGELTEQNAEFQPYDDTHQQADEVRELMERLRHRPEVEAVSLSMASHPYNWNNSSIFLSCDTLQSSGYIMRRVVTPDFLRVFRYRGTRGETPEELAAILEKGDILASDNLFQGTYGISMTSLVGKNNFTLGGDTTNLFRLGAALQTVRHDDYSQGYLCKSMVCNLNLADDEWINTQAELCVRLYPHMDQNFINNLKTDSEKLYRIGNLYISDVQSFQDIRQNYQQSHSNELRNYLFGMGFLLLNIFLSLLSTFWFRTQQRKNEIALHKVCGATNRNIFARLLCEGLLIVTLVTPLALLIDFGLAHLELNSWYNGTTLSPLRLLLCAVASYLVIAITLFVGIFIPARKAMYVQPAEALHGE